MSGVVTFLPMREADVPLLHEWIHRPHVAAWWGRGDTHDSVEDTKQKYLPRLEYRSAAKGYIALVSGEPIGFIQSYVAIDCGDGWWEDEIDPGVRGIDQFLCDSDTLGNGLGSRMVAAFVRKLFADPAVTKVQADPDPRTSERFAATRRRAFVESGTSPHPTGRRSSWSPSGSRSRGRRVAGICVHDAPNNLPVREPPMNPAKAPELLPFEVHAIKYATVARRQSENFIGGDPHEAGERMDYFVWLARSAERTIVIDTGFNEAAARRRRRDFLRSPVDGLKLLGVDAASVEDVVITHLHYDHVGNFDLFPRARFHLQDREMAYATGRYMAVEHFSHAYELDEVFAMVRNVYAGRVEFHDGDAQIAPGLSVHHIGGHTAGLQAVRIWTRIGWLVLASDASHYYANMNEPSRSRSSPMSCRWSMAGPGCASWQTLPSMWSRDTILS